MPTISVFFGITIRMYYDDHAPPHFHAWYGGEVAKVDIDNLSVIQGRLPGRALGLVIEWASLHQEELREAFAKVASMQPIGKIEPLR